MRRVALSLVAASSLSACCGAGPGRASHAASEYDAAVARVRDLAPPEATVVAAPPFVVAGDGPRESVLDDATHVVAWASTLLRKDFFDLEPGAILTVWLFASSESYERNASALYHDFPSTPYGYYAPCHGALIMNVATGYGTLVHEMVHPYMEANFPDAPVWFDEGLASLFERPAERDGHLWGEVNWRLPGLQAAILANRAKPLKAVLGLSRRAFYGDGAGLHYAEARYLLHWLQSKGLLRPYYRAFTRAVKDDPTGYRTLLATLGLRDDAGLDERWIAYVASLETEASTR